MLYPALSDYVSARVAEADAIDDARRRDLHRLARYVEETIGGGETARMTFICTHNSRRSHFAQIWSALAARHHGIGPVRTYSGGTDATAFQPRAVAALVRAGFVVTKTEDSENPVYEVRESDSGPVEEAYSKTFLEPPNPQRGFAAVMTCTDADEACPNVQGAELRVSLPYDDPKAYDGTDRESEAYDERCRQIAREMLYLFARVAGASGR